jgi:hypothetical protein
MAELSVLHPGRPLAAPAPNGAQQTSIGYEKFDDIQYWFAA